MPVAIIGMGCLFPKAEELRRFWSNIRNGVDAITEIPASHWDPADYFDADPKAPDRTYARRGGFIDPVDFPALDFGIAPTNLDATDTTQLLGLMVARAALEDAGYGAGREFDRDRVSVVLGVTGTLELVIPLGARLGHPIWRRALAASGVGEPVASEVVQRIADSYVGWQENSFPGLLGNVAAGRIANRLDLGGTNCVIDAACASSLGAVHLAMLELASGRCDIALTGGLDTFNDIFMYMCFSKTPALSKTGHARPFDAEGDGTTLGEGLGVLALKRLDDARRDGDKIYAVIKGVGSSSDGKGQAVYAPKSAGQAKALRRAYESAGISPATVGMVEAHGTGTKVGDAVEVAALDDVYRSARPNGPAWCALGSVKSQIGHTKAAAGAAGLIKAALALHHKVLPPTIKVERPLDVARSGPFYVNTEARPWLPRDGHPRRAAVSAFGFGGSNFHAVLEEAEPETSEIAWDGDAQIIAFSAATPEALLARLDGWPADADWPAARLEAARSRASFKASDPCRLLLVAERAGFDWPRLASRARALVAGPKPATAAAAPEGVYYAHGAEAPGGLGILFPGQGAQYVGMLRELACVFPEVRSALAEAEEAGPIGDRPLGDWIYPHPSFDDAGKKAADAALRSTDRAQPAIGAVSLGAYRLLRHFGVEADAFAGHSFGELTALCASGRIDAPGFFALANLRGRLMAGDPGSDRGGMLAVIAPADEVEKTLREAGIDLVLANRNSPRQVVLSGASAEIARAADAFKARNVTTRTLDVSAAFHSRYVAEASKPLLAALADIPVAASASPVFANTTAEPYPDDAAAARAQLAEQLAKPVRFVEQVEAMARSGIRTFLEVGPENRLTGLVDAILPGRAGAALALDSSRGQRSNLVDLARTLAHLSALGHPVRLDLWDEGYEAEAAARPRKGVTFKVSGANATPPAKATAPAAKAIAPAPKATAPAPTPARAATPAPAIIPPAARAVTLPDAAPTMSPAPDDRTPRPAGTNGIHRDHANGSGHATGNGTYPATPAVAQATPPAPIARPVATFAPAPVPSALADALRVSQENLVALQQFGEQTARLHGQFLEGQDRARQTFQSLLHHQQQLTLATLGMAPPPAASLPAASYPAPAPVQQIAAPAPAPIMPPPPPAVVARPAPVVAAAPAPRPAPAPAPAPAAVRPAPVAAAPKPAPAPIAAPAPAPVAAVAKPSALEAVHAALAEVVSEKTGYPAEVLEPAMQLDADLGIDSIKRVEILAALQERLPDAPVIGPEHVGTIRTLGQIAEFLAGGSGPAPTTTTAAPTPAATASAASVASRIGAIQDALAEVVSEKTGYPAEVLEPAMQLDADLGIDSIKRVEILAALQERLPDAPVIGPEHVGTIRTLGQIAEFLAGEPQAEAAPAPAAASIEIKPISKPAPAPVPAAPVLRLVPTVSSLPGDRPAVAARRDGAIWVLDDGSGLATAIAERLPAARVIARDGIAGLAAPDRLSGLVLLGGSAADAFRLLRLAAPGLRKEGAAQGAILATVSRLGGTFGLNGLAAGSDPAEGALAGLAKTAGHEWPEVACKAIDVDPAGRDMAALADAIVAELFLQGPSEVGLTREGAVRIDLPAIPTPAAAADPLRAGDVVVITGGARGVTAEVAVALASAFRPTIAILGRSPEPTPEPEWLAPLRDEAAIKKTLHARANGHANPKSLGEEFRQVAANREILANLRRIEAAGSKVVYRSVDVRDQAAVAATIQALGHELGPIRGLVHGAGVLADRKIEDQTDEQFDRVFATKVEGLDALLGAIGPDGLNALVLFSSSTARFGRTGQVAYAAANEVLNKTARREAQARPGCRVVSVNWGPWDGGMVTPALRPLFEAEGIALIPTESGASYLVDELRAGPGGPVEVVILGDGSRLPDGGTPQTSEPAPAAAPALTKVFERPLDLASTPILDAHVMDGRPVVPMSLILEWLAQGALHRNPGLVCRGVDDFRLLKGVIVRDDRPETIRVLAGKPVRRDSLAVVTVELRGVLADGREVLHARGEVVLGDRHPQRPIPVDEPSLAPFGGDRDEAYRDVLFHGPALRGIEAIEGCGDAGIAARVATAPAPAEWLDQPLRKSWITDPLALDCAFQMMILWSFERSGAGSLPTYIGRYRQFRRAFPADGVRVVARVTEASAHRARADIDFLDFEGAPVARIEDYECVIDASLASAFRRNRAARAESK
ncbi:SDR family NAD(P)-dependent oxidoreductase [Tundrisphaera sp. TA3]|uniref:SDR family NAD(P)-dependent oxidoreductase n=1 Tax=Tundrisphaera sp. TA3 TaxID=3435775 RepID=UPI003EBDD1F9